MHTNFDAAPGCMADLAAETAGPIGCVSLEALGDAARRVLFHGIGKSGFLKEEMTVRSWRSV